MSCKTPVTILQELMVKKQQTPAYNLILNQVGTHEPLFKYSVSGLGQMAIGSGKSKKEAKHEAARLLLYILKETMDIPDLKKNPILQEVDACYSPYDNTIKDNAVGDLQTFCIDFQLPNPTYKLILDIGPPHFKLFTIRCTVSSLNQDATARTKKQAKHRCSAAMLLKLKLCLSDYLDCSDDGSKTVSCDLAKRCAFLCYPLSDLHNVYKKSEVYFPSSKLEEFRKDKEKLKELKEPIDELKLICDDLNFELDILELPSKSKDSVVVNIFLVSRPGWSFIGFGENYDAAVNNTARDVLQFLLEITPEDKK